MMARIIGQTRLNRAAKPANRANIATPSAI
jgi:hypothetical protein